MHGELVMTDAERIALIAAYQADRRAAYAAWARETNMHLARQLQNRLDDLDKKIRTLTITPQSAAQDWRAAG